MPYGFHLKACAFKLGFVQGDLYTTVQNNPEGVGIDCGKQGFIASWFWEALTSVSQSLCVEKDCPKKWNFKEEGTQWLRALSVLEDSVPT